MNVSKSLIYFFPVTIEVWHGMEKQVGTFVQQSRIG